MKPLASIDTDEDPTPLLGLKITSPSRRTHGTNGHHNRTPSDPLGRVSTLLSSSRSVWSRLSYHCRSLSLFSPSSSTPTSVWQKLHSFSSIRRVRVVVALLLCYLLAVTVLAVTSETSHSISYYLLSPFSYRPGIGTVSTYGYGSRAKSSAHLLTPHNLSAAAAASPSTAALPAYNTMRERCVDQLAQPSVLSHWLGVVRGSATTMSVPTLAADGSVQHEELSTVVERIRLLRAKQAVDLRTMPIEQLWDAGKVERAAQQKIEAIDWSHAPPAEYSTLPNEVEIVVDTVQYENIDVSVGMFPLQYSAERDNTAAFFLVPSFAHPSLLTGSSGTFGSMVQHLNFNTTAEAAPSYLHEWMTPLTETTAADFTLLAPPSPAHLCAALLVPQIAQRGWASYPRFPRFGPDSARMAMHAERQEGGFEEYLDFEAVMYKERRWTQDDGWLPFDDVIDGGHTLDGVQVDRVEKRDMTVPVVVGGKPRKVRAQVKVTLRTFVQYTVHFDVGFSLYVVDVGMPGLYRPERLNSFSSALSSTLTSLLTPSKLSSLAAPSDVSVAPFPFVDAAGAIAPRVFTFVGAIEYNNYEWNPDPHLEYLTPAMHRIKYADKYHILLVPHPLPHSSAPPLPICTASNHTGYYARVDSPYVPSDEGYTLQRNVLDQSFYPLDCLYRFIDADESFSCMATRYPIVHWFGDSNSRRALRMLYTANRWGEEMIRLDSPTQCEDQEELNIAGLAINSTEWPYPLPEDEAVLCHYWRYANYSYVRLPRDTSERLDCQRATGSRLYYRFLLGMGWKRERFEWFDNLILNDYRDIAQPAALVIVNSGNWESQESVWDHTQSGQMLGREQSDEARQEYNLTWKLERLVDILDQYYVAVNPNVTIVFRGGNAWLTPRGETIRRHTTTRLHSISDRMQRHLLASRIAHRLLVWDVQVTRAYTAHDLDKYPTVGAGCKDGHSGVRQVALDNQIMLNGLCNGRMGGGGGGGGGGEGGGAMGVG